jgi:Reverse transcriptase (RNA-dependent DNA polymerase)
VEDARKRGFPLKVEVLLEPIMLKMATRGESDKQTCSATEKLMSAVTITTPSGPLCMCGVRQIIVEDGSEVFATLDFCQGYWQIPLHKDSQDCQSFITPDGVYTSTRVLHELRNAMQHLQSALVIMMDDNKSNIKVWLDDCLLHTKTEDDLFATLNLFFKNCQEHELNLQASKCVFFATTVRYCESLITKDGVRFDSKNMEALQTMHEPQNGADLVQYVAAVNWMRSAIPNHSKRVEPLHAGKIKLQPQCRCYTFEDQRSKRLSKIYKQLSWSQ